MRMSKDDEQKEPAAEAPEEAEGAEQRELTQLDVMEGIAHELIVRCHKSVAGGNLDYKLLNTTAEWIQATIAMQTQQGKIQAAIMRQQNCKHPPEAVKLGPDGSICMACGKRMRPDLSVVGGKD